MTIRRATSVLLMSLLVGLILVGCGEKIAIPKAVGLYSVSNYQEDGVFDVDDLRGLSTAAGQLFVLTGNALHKRNQAFVGLDSIMTFGDATSLCVADGDTQVFIWDQAAGEVSWYSTRNLEPPVGLPGSTVLPAVQSCVGMATSTAGLSQVPGAITYLYLADPDSGVVHRYAFDPYSGLLPHGILCRDNGEGARFVRQPAGLARDSADSMLVCDRITDRNWVIRFKSVPDQTDLADEGSDPLRGHAALFREFPCTPQPAAAYVLGDAAECGEGEWVGGVSDEIGAFNAPHDVAVDGDGQIFVADWGNNRVQIFSADGYYIQAFGDTTLTPRPTSIAVSDYQVNTDEIFHGAFLWVTGDGAVRKFLSADYFDWLNRQQVEE